VASDAANTVTTEEHNTCFEQWLGTHSAVLHHVANGFAEGADRHDLMQELMLAVWKAVPAFRHGAKLSTFIYRVAHNAALTWKRTQKNYQKRVDGFEASPLRELEALPETSSRERETLELLYAQIRLLAPVDRSLILLHLDGVSYAEMAEIHGLSESNVGVRLTRLKQKLSDAMKEVSHELR
jgi:RNA polymerase sigma factor (sigma-70 family)